MHEKITWKNPLQKKLKMRTFVKAKNMLEDIKREKIYMLKKGLYGLKQSGSQWYTKLNSELKTLDFVSSEIDPCIYTSKRGRGKIIQGLYFNRKLNCKV